MMAQKARPLRYRPRLSRSEHLPMCSLGPGLSVAPRARSNTLAKLGRAQVSKRQTRTPHNSTALLTTSYGVRGGRRHMSAQMLHPSPEGRGEPSEAYKSCLRLRDWLLLRVFGSVGSRTATGQSLESTSAPPTRSRRSLLETPPRRAAPVLGTCSISVRSPDEPKILRT